MQSRRVVPLVPLLPVDDLFQHHIFPYAPSPFPFSLLPLNSHFLMPHCVVLSPTLALSPHLRKIPSSILRLKSIVSKAWNLSIRRSITRLSERDADLCPPSHLSTFVNLTSLTFEPTDHEDFDLSLISSLNNLREFHHPSLRHLHPCLSRLTHLSAHVEICTDPLVGTVPFPFLTTLSLHSCLQNKKDLKSVGAFLSSLPLLTDLDAGFTLFINHDVLTRLRSLTCLSIFFADAPIPPTNLLSLTISTIDNESLSSLTSLTNLRSLYLRPCDDGQLNCLACFPNLTSLTLNETVSYRSPLSLLSLLSV